ncbi:MAG: hypothetical protein U1E38_10650 [Rhodospirillales bacterium]
MVGRRLLAATLIAGALAGCGSAGEPPPPEDAALARDTRLARLSFEQQRPEQAATLYRQALTQAQRRDDLPAIEDIGWNLAVVQLRTDRPADAVATARATRAEVVRRGGVPRPELLLVEAAALYRTGDTPTAARLAEAVIADPSAPAAARGRAASVRGLVAADASDPSSLRDALEQLDAVAAADPQAAPLATDRDELAGRLACCRGTRPQRTGRHLPCRRRRPPHCPRLPRHGPCAGGSRCRRRGARQPQRGGRSLAAGGPQRSAWRAGARCNRVACTGARSCGSGRRCRHRRRGDGAPRCPRGALRRDAGSAERGAGRQPIAGRAGTYRDRRAAAGALQHGRAQQSRAAADGQPVVDDGAGARRSLRRLCRQHLDARPHARRTPPAAD